VGDDELFADLSERLRLTHRRVAALEVSADEKARITRRLIAISDASKHELTRAAARLDVLNADLDAGRRPDPRDG
jgi:hypothetical protein